MTRSEILEPETVALTTLHTMAEWMRSRRDLAEKTNCTCGLDKKRGAFADAKAAMGTRTEIFRRPLLV